VGKRYDQGPVIDNTLVSLDRKLFVLGVEESDLRATAGLRQPDMPHGGKLKFSQDDFSPVVHPQGARDGIHAGRRASHQCDFLGIDAYEAGENSAGLLICLNPCIPWRPMLVPNLEILSERRFHAL
jgi:hypothetical protein